MTESLYKPRLESPVMRAVAAYVSAHGLLPDGTGVIVGVSGGPDSLCLLDVLRRLAPTRGWRIVAAHLDHQLRGEESATDSRYVAKLCHQWHVPCVLSSANVSAIAAETGRSVEETARIERYRFLAEVAKRHGHAHIAVAHHADDQVETVLMHLIRGAGLAGLRGMLPSSPLEGNPGISLVRPLLSTSRHDILAYCEGRGIAPRMDRSNLDTTYHRNSIRHELLPALERYNPHLRRSLAHTAESLAGDLEIVQDAVDDAWQRVVASTCNEAVALERAALAELPVGLQRRLVRRAIRSLRSSLRDIAWAHVEDAVRVLCHGATGDRATLPGGLELLLDYQRVWIAIKGYASPIEAPALVAEIAAHLPGVTPLANGWRIESRIVGIDELPTGWQANSDALTAYLDADKLVEPLELRRRRSNDKFVPWGETEPRSLRRYMINAKISAALRDSVPLLSSNDTIAWVVGWRLDARFAVTALSRRVMTLQCLRDQ